MFWMRVAQWVIDWQVHVQLRMKATIQSCSLEKYVFTKCLNLSIRVSSDTGESGFLGWCALSNIYVFVCFAWRWLWFKSKWIDVKYISMLSKECCFNCAGYIAPSWLPSVDEVTLSDMGTINIYQSIRQHYTVHYRLKFMSSNVGQREVVPFWLSSDCHRVSQLFPIMMPLITMSSVSSYFAVVTVLEKCQKLAAAISSSYENCLLMSVLTFGLMP